jgi:uncharacterized protein YjbJ (UPF0337 family)
MQMGELIDKLKGKIKQVGGVVSGDKKLELQGKVDEAKGDLKGAAAQGKRAVNDAMKK